MKWPFEPEIRALVNELVRESYGERVQNAAQARLGCAELRRAVESYGRSLIDPPESEDWLDVVPFEDGRGFSVNVPLWTKEEGRSDLTLSLTVRPNPLGGYQLEIDDVHVL